MGIYINPNKHPEIFNKKDKVKSKNQSVYRIDYLSEMLAQQQKANKKIQKSIKKLEKQQKYFKKDQEEQWISLTNQFQQLQISNQNQENQTMELVEQLAKLHSNATKQEEFIKQQAVFQQQLTEKVEQSNQSNQALLEKLVEYEATQNILLQKVSDLESLQKHATEKLVEQNTFHEEVHKRLESQEAIFEKLLRQVDYLRSIIYERTHHLTEKFEQGFQSIVGYFLGLISGKDHADQKKIFFLTQKEDEQIDEKIK